MSEREREKERVLCVQQSGTDRRKSVLGENFCVNVCVYFTSVCESIDTIRCVNMFQASSKMCDKLWRVGTHLYK